MVEALASLVAACFLVAGVSSCCVADGYRKAGCKDACNKSQAAQVTTCASMTGAAKTTCDDQTKTANEACLKTCEE